MDSVGLGRVGISRTYGGVVSNSSRSLRGKACVDQGAVDFRLQGFLSTFIIDRVPRVCLRAIRPKARKRIIRSLAASLVAVPVDPGYAQAGVVDTLIDDGKRKPGARLSRARDVPIRRKKKNPIADGTALATTEPTSLEELQRLAETLESVYHKNSTNNELDYDRILQELDVQSRTSTFPAAEEAPSCSSSPVVTNSRKRRGRPPNSAVNGSTLLTDQQPNVIPSPQQSKTGIIVRALPTVVVKIRAGEGKCRLNLISRIALSKRRQDRSQKLREVGTSIAEAAQDIWSPAADRLINQYGSALDLGVVDWNNLKRGLLSAADETHLAGLMKPVKNFQKIRKALREDLRREPSDEECAAASRVDINTLRRHISLGNSARNSLIQHNLRLVLFQAHKYHKESSSLSLFDLCQEGVLGLIRGVDKFDPKKGHRFSTYAIYWVRNSIMRAQTRSGSSLRSPYNVAMHKLNIKRARLDLLVEMERDPTNEEVMNRLRISPERFADILRSSARIGSMHKRSLVTGEEMVESFADNNLDENRSEMRQLSGDDGTLRFGVEDVLDSLKPREGLVLRQRFGLDGKGQRTLGEIGRTLGLSREMVRKYEARALLKMRQPTRMDYLRTYLSSLQ